MKKLHEMAVDYVGLLDSDFEPDVLKECLDSIEESIEEKGVNIVKVLQSYDNNISAIDAELKRIQSIKKIEVARKDRLKEYLRHNMESTGISKIQHPLFTITLGKAVHKVNVTDIDLLPDEFVNIKTEIKPDLIAIKKALKDGSIDGVELTEGKPRLLIK